MLRNTLHHIVKGESLFHLQGFAPHKSHQREKQSLSKVAQLSDMAQIPYQKLKQESSYLDDEDMDLVDLREKVIGKMGRKPSSFWNIKLRKVHLRKRLRIKVPSLKKFLRRKTRFIVAALAKTLKRLKESQLHFGDLFAGNYMFMQVNPTPLKICPQNPNLKARVGADHLHTRLSSLGSARYSF